ncbi:MAG: MlaC/ttg2D family ABC transporter substrate-binding protein [Candidatus Pelagibacterales bacterium]|jgi:phospholipid transport system substrate-binding protein|nr:ABC transporter substrate-binding protein [Pelagibacterales bacterium]MDA7764192.1 ABC transporter substrate-binding protein [Pelagibacterales bacterium]MDA9137486.1 ABC transporter substrate-binding protein [Pelagibacterales bacterium]
MQIKKIIILVLSFSFINTFVFANFEAEEKFVSNFADNAISILGNESLDINQKNLQFTDLVMSSIDMNLISKFVLSKYWKIASQEQRDVYIKAFEEYFISSYANKLDQYSGEKIVIVSSDAAKKFVIVKSNIVRDGADTLKIELDWRLLTRDGQTKIIDLSIEGISLIVAQREEFQSYLSNNDGDLDALINKLRSINNKN